MSQQNHSMPPKAITTLPNAHQYAPPSFLRKISCLQKQRLITLITQHHYFMKDAAKILRMSYSTAKKIMRRFKKEMKIQALKNTPGEDLPKATFKRIGEEEQGQYSSLVRVISTVGGLQQGQFYPKQCQQTD